ncbi:Detected protein of unknown function [Hibiscus syriacus]|uniref:Uncharacterized protein n=1 Tax=Hibiscus syriacus TaxID=106335 RepID=A0A6A2XAN1_HIBSY|nr:uncharacterized protein LOC120180472 isoform X1 [Hibiscus syriacus]KAE8666430.1 Detected protein of unknown function [Hibiscus syriacus]
MGAKTRSQNSSERQKWDKVFEGLVKMLKTQQQQLETLAKERIILEDRIKMQYERWVSDVRLYEDHISQMKSELQTEEMARVVEATKADMIVGLKHREAFLCKMKLEETEDELIDFRAWFNILSKTSKGIPQRNPIETKKATSGGKRSGSKSVTFETSEDDVRSQKLIDKTLVSEKSSQATALMAENNFAWNQLNVLESQHKDKLNSKQFELEKANTKIEALISNMEELRASNAERDEIIERLKAELSRKEADASRFQEVPKISRKVEMSRKPTSASCTPVIKRCAAGGRTSVLRGKNGSRDRCNIILKTENSALNVTDHKDNEKGSRSSKRKKDDAIPLSETPKLFTSTFKVPRLKATCPNTR